MEQYDPIQPDEIILRRIPESQVGTDDPRWPLPAGFDPHRTNDTDGLSVYREKHHSPEQVAGFRTKGTKPTWVARISAKSIIDLGLTLIPDPRGPEYGLPARPGHALIKEINSDHRKSDKVAEWKQGLVSKVIDVAGGDTGFAAPNAPSDET